MCRSSFPYFKIFVVIFSRIDVTFVISVFPKGQSRDRFFFNNCKYILWGVVFFASLYFLRWFGPRNPTNPFLASYFWKKQIFEDRLAFESSENAFTANWEEMSSFARKPLRSSWKVPIPMHTNKSENKYYRVLKDMQDFVTSKSVKVKV